MIYEYITDYLKILNYEFSRYVDVMFMYREYKTFMA